MARAPRASKPIAAGSVQAAKPRVSRRGWFGLGALGTLLVLGGGAYFAAGSQPALHWALEQAQSAGFDVSANELRGNLLSGVTATDATVKSAIVNGAVRSVTARYDFWSLLTRREVRLSVTVDGGKLNFDPGKLTPAPSSAAPAPLPVTLALQSLSVTNTSVKFLNRSFFSPDVRVDVLEQKPLPGKNLRGELKLSLLSGGGTGTADVRYEIGEGFATNLTANADLDARIARYWYEPIRAGRVRGTINLTPKFITAQARVENGIVEPLKGVFVRDVAGRLSLTADTKVSAFVTGRALDGDIEADVGVDISGERWSFLGKLNPSLGSALKTFAPGVAGTGRVAVTVKGGGWNSLERLTGTLAGTPNASAAGFPLRNLRGTWNFTDHLELNATAVSKLGSDAIPLTAKLKTVGERVLVDAKANGAFLKAPLALSAKISSLKGKTQLEASGSLLRGAVNAAGVINGSSLEATGGFRDLKLPIPLSSNLSGTARASGRLQDLNISGLLSPATVIVPGVKTRDVAGAYALNWNGKTLTGNANLGGGQLLWRGAIVNTNGAPARGDFTLRDLPLEPVGNVSAGLAYTLNANGSGSLSGQTVASNLNLQGASLEAAGGALNVAWNGASVKGRWDADKLLAQFTEKTLRVQPRDWKLEYGGERLALNGDMTLTYEGLRFAGGLTGRGALGEIAATGRGASLGLSGKARLQSLSLGLNGNLKLQPLAVTLDLKPSSQIAKLGGTIGISLSQNGTTQTLRANGTLLTGENRRLELRVDGSRLNAAGELDLSAVDAALPKDSRGLVRGVARFSNAGGNTAAFVRGSVSNVPLEGNLNLTAGRVTASELRVTGGDFSGAKLSGTVFPNLNATVSYSGATAKVSGNYSDLRFNAAGTAPRLEALTRAGISLGSQRFNASGRFVNGALRLTGNLGGLRVTNGAYQNGAFAARLAGAARVLYQGRPVSASGLNGTVVYKAGGLRVSARADLLSGRYGSANPKLEVSGRLIGVKLDVSQSGAQLEAKLTGAVTGEGGDLSGAYDGKPFAARGIAALDLEYGAAGLRVNAGVAALQGVYAGARVRLEGLTVRAAQGTQKPVSLEVAVTSKTGTAIYANERLALARVAATATLQSGRLSSGFETVLSGKPRGEALTGKLSGTIGLNLNDAKEPWAGAISLSSSGRGWQLTAAGPWSRVAVNANAPTATLARIANITLPGNLETTLRAQAFVSLPDASYQGRFSTAVGDAANRLSLNAAVTGIGAKWQVNATARDAAGGSADLSYNTESSGALNAKNIQLTALTQLRSQVSGALTLRGASITGALSGTVAALPVSARWPETGGFNAELGGSLPLSLSAERWTFPLSVTPITVTSKPSSLPIAAQGTLLLSGGLRFDGQLLLNAWQRSLPGGSLALTPQSFPLSASANGGGIKLRLEGNGTALRLDGKGWGGGLDLRYRAWDRDATLTLTAAGELADPTLNLETRGFINAQGSANLREAKIVGSVNLKPLTGALSDELQAKVSAGRLQFSAELNPSTGRGTATANLNGSAVDGEAAKLQVSASLGDKLEASGAIALGNSRTAFSANQDGLEANRVDLDLRLLRVFGITASGTARGALSLPAYDLKRGDGQLEFSKVQAFGASADGLLTLQRGAVSADLRGQLPGKYNVSLRGALLPNTDAALELDGLSGRVTGTNLEGRGRSAAVSLDGSFMGKTATLEASLRGAKLNLSANWDALKLTLGGTASEDGVRLTGALGAGDLRGVAGVAGNLTAKLEYSGSALKATQIRGAAAGFDLSGEAHYENGELSVDGVKFSNADFSGSASGRILPSLRANANLVSRNVYAPGSAKLSATGTLETPVVTVEGALAEATQGLILPGETKLTGRLDGRAWTVTLSGKAIDLSASGNLSGVERASLQVGAPLRFADTKLTVSGAGTWSRAGGFGGALSASGDLIGSPAQLKLGGAVTLNGRLEWRKGALNATLPAGIGGELNAALSLERFDIAALWGKPDQLFVAGAGRAVGTWSAPSATFSGAIESANKSLDSRLELKYSSGGSSVTLRGERLNLDAALTGTDYRATGAFKSVALETLLPFPAKSLRLDGDLRASGALDGKLPNVEFQNLGISGEIAPIGVFSASGSAALNQNLGSADLTIRALAGTIRALGRIGVSTNAVSNASTNSAGNELALTLQGLNLEPLGVRGGASGRIVLRGAVTNPNVAGELNLVGLTLPGQTWGANATLRLSEKLLNPTLMGAVDFTGGAVGRLQVSVKDALSAAPKLSLRGTAKLPELSLNADLGGSFPKLTGTLGATVTALPTPLQKIALEGLGDGRYRVSNAGVSGELQLTQALSLLETKLTGTLQTQLEASSLLPSAGGRVGGAVTLAGTLGQPRASFAGDARAGAYNGVTIPDVTLSAAYAAGKLSLRGTYAGGGVSWDGAKISVTKLPLSLSGYKLLVNANGSSAPIDVLYSADLSGDSLSTNSATGRIGGRLSADSLDAQLNATLAGFTANGAVQGSPARGWIGVIGLRGLPKDSLLGTPDPSESAGNAELRLSGAFDKPVLSGEARTLGGRVAVTANFNPLEVRLSGASAPEGAKGAAFTGTVTLSGDKLGGKLAYDDGGLALSASPTGTLQQPNAAITAAFGRARGTANLRLQNGAPGGTLTISDGARSGEFTLNGTRFSGSMPGFDLSSLEQAGFGGTVALNADLTQDATVNVGWRGRAAASFQNISTPFEVPALGWKVDGTGSARFDTASGALAVQYSGTPGTANADLRLEKALWVGAVNLDLHGDAGNGSIKGTVSLGPSGINGRVNADSLPLTLMGIAVNVTGAVTLEKDGFSASGVAQTLGGSVTASGSGGLSDLLPFLEPYTKSKPGELGYSLRARLDTVKLEDIAAVRQFVPGATGRAIGVVQVTDGIGTFQLSIPELTLPDITEDPRARVRLGFRISGTAAGNSVRYNGHFVGLSAESGIQNFQPILDGYGESVFSGSYNGSSASGLLEMRRAPLHSLIGAAFGALPGRAVATGLARYNLPFSDLAKAELRVALERLEIEGGGDTLVGHSALTFKNGDLTLDSLDLRGKGRWTGGGRYTQAGVNLNLDFENTSFKPVLALIPTLRDYNPDASGTVKLRLSGRYDFPNATLEVANFKGKLSGIELSAPSLQGSLQDGAFKLSGTISSDPGLGAVLQTTATATVKSFNPVNISNLEGVASGSLNIRPLGLIEDLNARIFGASGGFKLEATGKKGGALSVSGDISPVVNLKLTGRNLIVPIPEYFVADSLLDANIGFRGDGAKSYIVSGDLGIVRLSAALNQGQRTAISPAKPVSIPAPAPATRNPFLEQIKLGSVRVSAPQGIRLNESFASLEAGGTITLTGTAAAPEASGSLEALGSSSGKGTIRLGANSYTIQSATANFAPVEGIYPVVNIDSKGKVRAQLRKTNPDSKETLPPTIDVNLRLGIRWIPDASGVRKLEITPTISYDQPPGSEPLSPGELYSLVTLGTTSGTLSGIGQQALDTAFSLFFLSEFSRQFKEATGVDLTVSTNLFDYIFNPGDYGPDQNNAGLTTAERNQINFTFNLGFDLSKAVRLNVELQTAGRGAVNLNYQSEDGQFGIRFSTPFNFNEPSILDADALFGGLQPEFALSYNISSLNAFTLSFQVQGNDKFTIKFGFSFRF